MNLKNRIANKILQNSDLYKKQQKEIKKLNKNINRLKEVNKSSNRLFNTIFLDYELTPSPILRDFRELSLELLKFVDNICHKYELDWWIEYGTLLGAVRHGGFVPWDDDLDAGMMRSDYNKFSEYLLYELDRYNLRDIFYLRYKPRDKIFKGATGFLQIFIQNKEPYKINVTGLDIFPYDYMKKYDGEDIGNLYHDSKIKFYRDTVDFDDFDVILKRYYENLNLTYEKSPYFVGGVDGGFGPHDIFGMKIFETEKLFPLKLIDFEGLSVWCPNDSDYHLKTIYGNYRNIPQRLTFHNRLKNLRKYPNINEVIGDLTTRLSEVNNDFE